MHQPSKLSIAGSSPAVPVGDLFSIFFTILLMQITYRLSYSSRDEDTRETIMDLDMNFENPTDEFLASRINTWLTAIGKKLEVVVKS